jgi:N-acetylneuraminic acid mutarotase
MNLLESKKLLLILLFSASILFTGCEESVDASLTGNWIERSDFEGASRSNAVSFVIGNKAYVGTGYDGDDYLQDFWEFSPNPQLGFWIQKAPFPGTARSAAVAFSINGKGYVGTGYDGDDNLRDFWEYTPETNSWKRIADFGGTARRSAVAFSINGKGYVGAGRDDNDLKDFWEYNPANDTWTQIVSMGGSKRISPFALVIGNKAFIGGGRNNGAYQEDLWEFDPSNSENPWVKKTDLSETDESIARESSVSFTIDGKGYLVAGSRGSILGDVWEYDPVLDTWTEKNEMEGAFRTEAVGFTIDNRGFIATGRGSSERYDDIWEFKPDEDENEDD